MRAIVAAAALAAGLWVGQAETTTYVSFTIFSHGTEDTASVIVGPSSDRTFAAYKRIVAYGRSKTAHQGLSLG